ncbi:MAG: acetyl-CoA carboxylase biotin carboxyl carrier protein [Eubacteriales bacterium]|nr:acetyl-CoA carboxylase biotin carboxyl carrier protein [Eubacteriales bacterium]
MEFGQIIDLIKAVSDSNLTEFEIQDGETKISMETNKETKQITVTAPLSQPQLSAVQPAVVQEEEKAEEKTGNIVKSPLVGTFYQSASPESEPFVKEGDIVKKGQVLGIVEAMKLMNEIESEYDGTVKEILVKNEQMVEFGQPMFVIG